METYTIKNLNFTYPGKELQALSEINLEIENGEFITICGKSGCGKSTLLKHLKSVLTPHGKRTGEIYFEGAQLEKVENRNQSSDIGYVLQSPDNQIVTDKVWHELAFGLESLGYDSMVIRRRVAEMASFFGIQQWFRKNVTELSGGQKQLLNLAAVMAMQPKVLILDEPTSQLDPIAASDFLETISKINRELGITIIISEHRLEDVLPMSDRVIVMDDGQIIVDDSPAKAGEKLKYMNHSMFIAMPAPMRIFAGVANQLECPITVRDGRQWLNKFSESAKISKDLIPRDKPQDLSRKIAIELKELWFRYEKDLPDTVKGLSAKIYQGEIYALVGGNGTGKSTTLSLISGIRKPYRGKVYINQREISKIPDQEKFQGLLGVLPQNPQTLFVKKTVGEDLQEMLYKKNLSETEVKEKIASVVGICELEDLLDMHPYDLSGGEQQRAALAKVLLLEPEILLLDEPTKGLDGHFKQKLALILKKLQSINTTIIMVSHDVEFCGQYADRCAMFFDGAIVSEDTPRNFFSGNSFYTTASNRMARHILPQAIVEDDVILACGGEVVQKKMDISEFKIEIKKKPPAKKTPQEKLPNNQVEEGERKLSKRTVAASLMILLAIPLTIWFGIYYLNDRKYYIISMMVILETMIPFVMVFERRKPQARELVIISVLCAIAVAGRAAFFMIPQFKPVVAIVIIAGVCFGGEAGFLVGAVSGFVSNFFFGQGPYTPWQMFAFGIIGFLAGVLFRKGLLLRDKKALCVFGGLATFIIYGGLMNPAAVIIFQNSINMKTLMAAYISGIPFDLIHAASTVIFLYIISEPMLEKLDRIKMKYGLLEN
ncbi:MAG: energy-coupling factor transporter ATPase [Proteocatella sp.]